MSHLPSKALPPLSPDWTGLGEFILKSRWQFVDEGDRYRYFAEFTRARIYVPKSELGNDTVKVIELLRNDVDKFYSSSDDIVGKGEKIRSSPKKRLNTLFLRFAITAYGKQTRADLNSPRFDLRHNSVQKVGIFLPNCTIINAA